MDPLETGFLFLDLQREAHWSYLSIPLMRHGVSKFVSHLGFVLTAFYSQFFYWLLFFNFVRQVYRQKLKNSSFNKLFTYVRHVSKILSKKFGIQNPFYNFFCVGRQVCNVSCTVRWVFRFSETFKWVEKYKTYVYGKKIREGMRKLKETREARSKVSVAHSEVRRDAKARSIALRHTAAYRNMQRRATKHGGTQRRVASCWGKQRSPMARRVALKCEKMRRNTKSHEEVCSGTWRGVKARRRLQNWAEMSSNSRNRAMALSGAWRRAEAQERT